MVQSCRVWNSPHPKFPPLMSSTDLCSLRLLPWPFGWLGGFAGDPSAPDPSRLILADIKHQPLGAKVTLPPSQRPLDSTSIPPPPPWRYFLPSLLDSTQGAHPASCPPQRPLYKAYGRYLYRVYAGTWDAHLVQCLAQVLAIPLPSHLLARIIPGGHR